MNDSDLRAVNARIAGGYDRLPYEAPPEPALDVRRVLGVGAVYGCNAGSGDVLDLGCGTGLALARAGQATSGRLVGVDLSQENCRKARARCESFGPRAEILAADFLDLDAEKLGQFDVIYAVGILYVVPPEVKRHVMSLIAQCLGPGGIVAISHYSGTAAALRAHLHGLVRAGVHEDDSGAALRAARARLGEMAMRLEGSASPLPALARQSLSLPDTILYHEVFNPWFAPLGAAALQRDFSGTDIGFISHTDPGGHGELAAPVARAWQADLEDLAGGAYRYSLFGRGAGAPDLHAPGIVWKSELVRAGDDFRHPAGATIRVVQPLTRALLDELVKAETGLDAALARVNADPAVLEGDLMSLWNARFITPRLA